MDLVTLDESHLPEAEALLDVALGGRTQVRLGERVDVLALPGLVALAAGDVAGVVTWAPGPATELACLAVAGPARGTGVAGRLVEAVVTRARTVGAGSVWLVTTNDNLAARRLYQRHGFRLVRVVPGGIDVARELKPRIPLVGEDGIPLHDELVLERGLS